MTTPSDPQPPQQPGWGQGQPPPAGGPQYGPPAGGPQYGPPAAPPQYGPPPAGPPQHGPPPAGPPQYGPPEGGPQYGPPPDPHYGQWQQQPVPLTPPGEPKRRGKLVAAAAAAVVVIGGGVGSYVAVSSSSDSGGTGSPKAAVQSLVSDLDNADLIGLLDDLPPAERDTISKPFQQTLNELKRNDILRPDADLSRVGGVSITTSGITYSPKTITINDHVQIVQLTAGKIAINADATKVPFTSDFLHAVAPEGIADAHGSTTLDVKQVVHETGHPLRIAAQKSGGKWYPSLLYTIADNATTRNGLQAPSPADRIPAVGASTPDDAVRTFIQAALQGNVKRAAELLSPQSLAVLHDYGKLITDRLHYSAPGIQLKDIQFTDSTGSGGTRVVLKSLELIGPDQSELKLQTDGSCVRATYGGESRRLCSTDLLHSITGSIGHVTAAQQRALNDLLSGLAKAPGIDVTQVDGQWYLDPLRSYFDLANVLLSGLKGDDGHQLLLLIGQH